MQRFNLRVWQNRASTGETSRISMGECQQKQQSNGGRFEMTHFLSKFYAIILALDINALVWEYDIVVD